MNVAARVVVEQRAVLLSKPVALALHLLRWPFGLLARVERADVGDDRRVRDGRVVVPAAVVVVEPVAGGHVEPRVLRPLELLEPRATGVRLAELRVDLRRRAPFGERAVDLRLDRELREAEQLTARLEQDHVDAGDHLRDVLLRDVRQRALAEVGERDVGAVAEQQELEVVLPHQVAAAERARVRGEDVDDRRVPVRLLHQRVRLVLGELRHGEVRDLRRSAPPSSASSRRTAPPSARSSSPHGAGSSRRARRSSPDR